MHFSPLDCDRLIAAEVFDDRQHHIREVSDRFGVSLRTIRFYEQLGLIRPQRTATRNRLFDLDDITRIAFIVSLRRYDVSVPRVAELLALRDAGEPERLRAAVSEALAERRGEIDREIRRLTALRDDADLWLDDLDVD